MSTRQLRKLQKQKELEQAQVVAKEEDAESDESDAEPAPAVKPRVSLFAALGGDEDEADDGDEDDKDADNEAPKAQPQESIDDTPPAAPSKKKKKKKKKGKGKATAAVQGADEVSDEDEIDKAIKELKLDTRAGNSASAEGATYQQKSRMNELLSINKYHLNVMNEMRNVFGREIIESANAEEQEAARQRRRENPRQMDLETFLRGPPGQKKLPEVSLRRNAFIQGREHWPRATVHGLNMKQLGVGPDGASNEYAYEHGAEYNAAQAFFFSCVQIGDPMRMVYVLQHLPYHVSTLLQVSSIAKQDQNMALAAELCERALFTFGRVATVAFRNDMEKGRARLDFRRPENRQFWLAGYHYLKSLIRKGTYRTALEWAKLMFAFNHEDPYAMRHFLHFLAIRAHETTWLADFLNELEYTGDNRDTKYLRQSLVLAYLQKGHTEAARDELRKGMRRVPWMYCALFQELGLDAPPSIWGINADTENKTFWTKLYIYQTKDLWNNPQATTLLKEVATSLEKLDKSLLPQTDDPPVDLGATRLAFLEGQGPLMGAAPKRFLERQPNYEFDPLPPAEEENIFTGEACRMPWVGNQAGRTPMDNQIEAQLLNALARRAERRDAVGQGAGAAAGAAAGAGVGAFANFGVNDEDQEEEIGWDDARLQAELERINEAMPPEAGHVPEEGEAQRGLLQMLLDLGRRNIGDVLTNAEQFENNGQEDSEDDDENDELLPGAWPRED